jgi:hypothetical protein
MKHETIYVVCGEIGGGGFEMIRGYTDEVKAHAIADRLERQMESWHGLGHELRRDAYEAHPLQIKGR